MKQNKKPKTNVEAYMEPGFVGTNPQKVKQDIQKDVSHGEGAMSSREAGHMRD